MQTVIPFIIFYFTFKILEMKHTYILSNQDTRFSGIGKKLLLTISALIFSIIAFSQNCNCENNFIWLKNFFEKNDAGFQYAVNQKGIEAYETLNEKTLSEVKNIQDKNECYHVLYNWLKFFRKGHFGVWAKDVFQNAGSNKIINIDTAEFVKYLNQKKEIDYEGIWEYNFNHNLKIGIKKIDEKYFGFVISADSGKLKTGQVLFFISTNNNNNSAVLYSNNKEIPINSVALVENQYLLLEFILLQRLQPESITANPFFTQLNKSTNLLTIPSFDISCKKEIDSIIKVNFTTITNTENLIIDLRNNGGGTDGSYKQIIPLLYTNPIRNIGVKILATKENALRYVEAANNANSGFSADNKKWFMDISIKLNEHLGEFVNINNSDVDTVKLDTIYSYPENVGIIINKNNGSSAEQFLLAAKQSKKVKLFGTSTMGELDISNVWFADSPCKDFRLAYSVTKSLRVPEMTVDNDGIQPDFYIDESISNDKWIDFVENILNSN